MLEDNTCNVCIKVKNKLGLHARPASMFVEEACKFESEVFIKKDNTKINAKSIMGILMLAAACGTELILSAEGCDSKEAIEHLTQLIEGKFGEE